jgi:hypothetical protein
MKETSIDRPQPGINYVIATLQHAGPKAPLRRSWRALKRKRQRNLWRKRLGKKSN